MPRRKYGHMVGACPPTPKEKCRSCRLGHPCNVHNPEEKLDYKALRTEKKIRFSGGKKGKKKIKTMKRSKKKK